MRVLGLVACFVPLGVPSLGCGGSQPTGSSDPPDLSSARYYVAVPLPRDASTTAEPESLRAARAFLQTQVANLQGVAVAPQRETARESSQAIRAQGLAGFTLDSTVRALEARADGRTRASVEVIVRTHPGGKIVGSLRTAATAYVDVNEPLATRQQRAIEGALQGALRGLPALIARGDT